MNTMSYTSSAGYLTAQDRLLIYMAGFPAGVKFDYQALQAATGCMSDQHVRNKLRDMTDSDYITGGSEWNTILGEWEYEYKLTPNGHRLGRAILDILDTTGKSEKVAEIREEVKKRLEFSSKCLDDHIASRLEGIEMLRKRQANWKGLSNA